jgi:hypothetical protein
MRTSTRLASLVSALALLLTACGGSDPSSDTSAETASSTQATSSSAGPAAKQAPAPFVGTVDNTAIGGDCLKVDCWQPTQFGPNLVELESVSLEEQATSDGKVTRPGWPNNGDQVDVVCIALGGAYKNNLDQTIRDWYGIRIPADKVEPTAKEDPRVRKTPDGKDYMGFIGISWITGGETKRAPACPTA